MTAQPPAAQGPAGLPAASQEVESSVPLGRRAARPPPPLAAPRAASPLQDQRCGDGPWRGQLRRSELRVAAHARLLAAPARSAIIDMANR